MFLIFLRCSNVLSMCLVVIFSAAHENPKHMDYSAKHAKRATDKMVLRFYPTNSSVKKFDALVTDILLTLRR